MLLDALRVSGRLVATANDQSQCRQPDWLDGSVEGWLLAWRDAACLGQLAGPFTNKLWHSERARQADTSAAIIQYTRSPQQAVKGAVWASRWGLGIGIGIRIAGNQKESQIAGWSKTRQPKDNWSERGEWRRRRSRSRRSSWSRSRHRQQELELCVYEVVHFSPVSFSGWLQLQAVNLSRRDKCATWRREAAGAAGGDSVVAA